MSDLHVPPLTVDDLLRMVGERDVRIEQLTRRVLELLVQRATLASPPAAPEAPDPCPPRT